MSPAPQDVVETLREGAWAAWARLVNAHEALSTRKTPGTLSDFQRALDEYKTAFATYDGELIDRLRAGTKRP